MRLKSLLIPLSCAFMLSACGSEGGKSSSKSSTYRYNFNVQHCTPSVFKGRFKSQVELCQALSYQAQIYPCAAPQIMRTLEDNNCHRSDFLQGQPHAYGHYQPTPGVFYNENQEPYIITPQGTVKLESPSLNDPKMQQEYERVARGESFTEEEIDDGLTCIQGICVYSHETLEFRDGKAIINGQITLDLTLTDDKILGPNAHRPDPTLVRPDSTTSQPRPKKDTVTKETPSGSSNNTTTTVTTRRPEPRPAETITPPSTDSSSNKEVPLPRPRPEDLGANTTKAPEEEKTSEAKPSENTTTTTATPPAATTEDSKTSDEEAAAPVATPPTDSSEAISDVSNETAPNDFNLIYFTSTGAMYTEIPNPQSQHRFPILKVTAKIDSRSPLHNKKHAHPIKELDVQILNSTSTCEPTAQFSSNNDIVILTLKVKKQDDVTQIQACKDWFQNIRRTSFEIQTSDLQSDKGNVTGKFNFILTE